MKMKMSYFFSFSSHMSKRIEYNTLFLLDNNL